jgi:acetyl-CoA carboxylase biotin carboxyl carrier protein
VSLTAADVAEIVRLLEESTFDELTLEINGTKLSLRRGAGVQRSATPAAGAARNDAANPGTPVSEASGPASSGAVGTGGAPATPAPSGSAVQDPDVREITSPLLGTFYRAPKPGASPFVEVGSQVEEDTVVAIIEVMKLMNTVRAGVRGRVSEVLVSDGVLVEYGQPLFRVRTSG